MKPRFFRSAKTFRSWLERHHRSKSEQWVGFHKKHTGRAGLTYDEAVDEALCFGWIDGIIRSIDDVSYMHRFTPRKPTSHWSAVNLRKMERLMAEGRVAPAGEAIHASRDRRKDASYGYERTPVAFTKSQRREFRQDPTAWEYWERQPPGYRRNVTNWVTSAKRPETRIRRFASLMECCRNGERLPQFG